MDAKKIWSYARRLLAIIPSIFICALGVALLVWPEWGCDPLTTFEIGVIKCISRSVWYCCSCV